MKDYKRNKQNKIKSILHQIKIIKINRTKKMKKVKINLQKISNLIKKMIKMPNKLNISLHIIDFPIVLLIY
jgi:hypothetical protein